MPKDSEFNNDNKFDIDLKVGQSYEKSLAEILRFGKVEVKTEIDTWRHTGNIAIEIRCRGKLSGLSVTEADYWSHILSYSGFIKTIIIFPVGDLKRIIKTLKRKNKLKLIMGGDDNQSELALLPLNQITDLL